MTCAEMRTARMAWLLLTPRERRNLSFDDLLVPRTPATPLPRPAAAEETL